MYNITKKNNKFYYNIKSNCKPGCYNLFLHKHLGDVFYAIGLKDAFEKTHKAPLHFIIRPQHEFLMKMYNITNYSVCDISWFEKNIEQKNYPYITPPFNKALYFDIICKDIFSNIPIKNEPFVIDGDIGGFIKFNHYWALRWAYNCGINIDNFKFNIPSQQASLSPKALSKIKKIAPLNKIVLFAPEAATATELAPEFWNEIAEEVHKKGYSIIVNSKKYKISHGISAFDLNLSLEDVVALGFNCANVFSLRSGLCDVLVGAGKKLYAFYPAMLRREMFSLSQPFSHPSKVNEIGIYNWKIDSVKWQGIDLTPKLQKQINVVYKLYLKEKIKAFFNFGKRKEGNKWWYNLFRNVGGISKMFPENNLGNPRPKQNVNLKFLGIPLWQKKYIKEGDGQKKVIKILGGPIKYTKSANNAKKLNILGIGVMTHKFVRFETIKILGVTVFKKDRQPKFLQWFLEQCGDDFDDVYIIPYNIGETSVYLSHLKQWIKNNGSQKPLIAIHRKKDLSMYKMFDLGNAKIAYVPISNPDANNMFGEQIIKIGNHRIYSVYREIVKVLKRKFKESQKNNLYRVLVDHMQLKENNPYTLPQIDETQTKELMSCLNLGNKFVVVCPEATSLKELSKNFWNQIVKGLQNKGYQVFVNAFNPKNSFAEAINQPLTIPELYAISSKASGVISLASGVTILMSMGQSKMDLIYTDFKRKELGCGSTLGLDIYSVQNMPWNKNTDIKEYDVAKISEDELIKNILERY